MPWHQWPTTARCFILITLSCKIHLEYYYNFFLIFWLNRICRKRTCGARHYLLYFIFFAVMLFYCPTWRYLKSLNRSFFFYIFFFIYICTTYTLNVYQWWIEQFFFFLQNCAKSNFNSKLVTTIQVCSLFRCVIIMSVVLLFSFNNNINDSVD